MACVVTATKVRRLTISRSHRVPETLGVAFTEKPMPTNDPADNELVAQLLDAHDATSVDDLPHVVQNTIEACPDACVDAGHPLATTGGSQ